MNKRRGERDDKEKRRGKEWRDEGRGEGRISIRGTGIRKKDRTEKKGKGRRGEDEGGGKDNQTENENHKMERKEMRRRR